MPLCTVAEAALGASNCASMPAACPPNLQGEYSGANELQDDVAIIGNLFNFATDDHGNTAASATVLASGAAHMCA